MKSGLWLLWVTVGGLGMGFAAFVRLATNEIAGPHGADTVAGAPRRSRSPSRTSSMAVHFACRATRSGVEGRR